MVQKKLFSKIKKEKKINKKMAKKLKLVFAHYRRKQNSGRMILIFGGKKGPT